MINYDKAKELYIQGKSLRAIAQELNINRKLLSKKLKEEGIIIRDPNKNVVAKSIRKHPLNESVFETIDTEEKAYWLGFLYADGYINEDRGSIELALAEYDLMHIEKFKAFLDCDNEIKYRPNTKSYRLIVYSKKITNDLVRLGCFQAKSLLLRFPNESQVPTHLIHHFMRGYFDGDGCIANSKPNEGKSYQLRFSVIGTKEFLDDYENLLLINMNKAKANKRIPQGNAYAIRYSGNKQNKCIFNFLYNNATIYLDRKYTKFIAVLGQEEDDKES